MNNYIKTKLIIANIEKYIILDLKSNIILEDIK